MFISDLVVMVIQNHFKTAFKQKYTFSALLMIFSKS
jgi:hypothetical protein